MTLVNVMLFAHYFFPYFFIWRKEHIGILRHVVYLCQTKPVGYVHCLGIHTCSTYYIYIVILNAMLATFLYTAMPESLVERLIALASWKIRLCAA